MGAVMSAGAVLALDRFTPYASGDVLSAASLNQRFDVLTDAFTALEARVDAGTFSNVRVSGDLRVDRNVRSGDAYVTVESTAGTNDLHCPEGMYVGSVYMNGDKTITQVKCYGL